MSVVHAPRGPRGALRGPSSSVPRPGGSSTEKGASTLPPHGGGNGGTSHSSSAADGGSSFSSVRSTADEGWEYHTREEIARASPSRRDMSSAEERWQRSRCCRFILDLGESLRVPQPNGGPALSVPQHVIGVATILFHRLFTRVSMRSHNPLVAAVTCVFLAAKVEEFKIRLKDVLAKCHELQNCNDPGAVVASASAPASSSSSSSSSVASSLGRRGGRGHGGTSGSSRDPRSIGTDEVLIMERVLLHSIAFEICVTTPFPYLKKLRLKVTPNVQLRARLSQVAHQYVKDTLHTTLCLQFRPGVIAVAAIFLASQFIGVKIGKQWWRQLPDGSQVDRSEVISCCHQILEVFEEERRQENFSFSSESSKR